MTGISITPFVLVLEPACQFDDGKPRALFFGTTGTGQNSEAGG